jgi:carbon storage regulator
MLVLSRKPGESVYIGNNIEVKVVSISKDRVKLGFEAPRDISLIRGELRVAVIGANIEASKSIKDITLLKNLSLKKQG